MRLISFLRDGRTAFGCIEGDHALDFRAAGAPFASLRDCLPGGLDLWRSLAAAVTDEDRVPLDQVELIAPVPDARNYLALGGNYRAHAEEAERAGIVRAPVQTWFNKQITCINGPYADIERPWVSEQMDYEGELGVVIGRDCRHVAAAEAWAVVAGYVVCNDVSVRDWQLRSPTHTLGKSFDTHGPFGPWIVTRDEIPDVHTLDLRVTVNGEERQRGNTGDMIYRVPEMIEELTTCFTLRAGDILSTGTPSGVGGLMSPPQYLQAGDVVRVEIEKIGHIENRVIDEPSR